MSAARPPSRGGWALMIGLAAAVLAADQATKLAVRAGLEPGERIDLLLGIELVRTTNTGIAFGLLDGAGAGLLVLVASVAIAGLVAWFALEGGHRFMQVAVGLLVGGAVGNVVDRLLHQRVTDFVDLPGWPAFNLADVGISFGVLLLALGILLPDLRARLSRR